MKYLAALVSLSAVLFLAACRPGPEKLLATANKYHENKKYKEASILYQKVIAKDKTNAEAYYREGLNLIDEGQPGNAAAYLRRAVDLRPDNADAESKLADIYLTAYLTDQRRLKNLLPDIVDLKKKLLQHNPNSFDGLRLEGLLDLTDRKPEDALQAFERANQVKPHSRELIGWYAQVLMATNHAERAEALVRDMLAQDKTWGPGYDFLFLYYSREKEPQKAEAVLRERVQNDPSDAIGITNLANYLLQTGRYDDAEATMKRVVANKTAFPNGREMMGDFYARARKYDLAIQEYQFGAHEDPKNETTYQQRIVRVYAAENKTDQALQLAKSLAQKNPKDGASSELYASLLLSTANQANIGAIVPELKRLVQSNPTESILRLDLARAYMGANDSKNALAETLQGLQDEAKNKPPRRNVMVPGRLMAARLYERLGQHAQALDQSQQALQMEPNSPEARLLHDQSLIGLNQGGQAQTDLEQLVQQYPQSVDARLALGNLYYSQKDYAKAAEEFDQVSKANDARGYVGLQQVKLAQGKVDEAIKAMTDLVNKNPTRPTFRYELAGFQSAAAAQLSRTNPTRSQALAQQAADSYKELLKTQGNSPDIWVRLGALQRQLGQNDAALGSFEQATNLDPKNVPALVNRGMVLEALGRKKEAADFYNKTLGIDPNNIIALNNLAVLNAENGTNLDQAMTFAQQAQRQDPHSPEIADTLGYVMLKKNLNGEAVQIFKQNVQDQPENSTFRLHLAMGLLKQGDKTGARTEAEKALKSAPPGQQPEIRSFVGQIG